MLASVFGSPRALLALAVVIASSLLPARALGCACCGGYSRPEPLGWNAVGELFVRVDIDAACERKVVIEVLRDGKAGPVACYDLLGEPSKKIECGTAVAAEGEPRPKSVAALQARLLPLQSADPALFAGSYFAKKAWPRSAQLTLWDISHVEPKAVLRLNVDEYEYAPPADVPSTLVPLLFAILPKPTPPSSTPPADTAPRRAAILVRGMDGAYGTGHESYTVRWVTLDAEPERIPGLRYTRALPTFGSIADPEPGYHSRFNSAGLALLERGKLDEAREKFEAAVAWNPAHVLARYNLACTLARQGYSRHALRQLNELFSGLSPEAVPERRERALVDPDLASLRGEPEFARIVCGGTCPAPAVATSSSSVNPMPAASGSAASSPESAPRRAEPPASKPSTNAEPRSATRGCALAAQRRTGLRLAAAGSHDRAAPRTVDGW